MRFVTPRKLSFDLKKMKLIIPAYVCSHLQLTARNFWQTLEEQITRYFHDVGNRPSTTRGESEKKPRLFVIPAVLDLDRPS